MTKNNSAQVRSALSDVRKAFRTLYTYQRMVLDLGAYIGQRLSLEYRGGYPHFSAASPRPGKSTHFDNWAWDWLNMYCYEFFYVPRFQSTAIKGISVMVVSDTGYWESDHKNPDECQPETFLDPDHSQSKILLIVGKNQWPHPLREENAWLKERFASSAADCHTTETGTFVAQAFDVDQFINAELADRCLSQFVGNCNVNGVEMQPLSEKL